MNIGFDAKRAFRNASGLGNYSRNTLNALKRYFPGNKYALYTPSPESEHFDAGPPFRIVPPPNLFYRLFKPLWRSFFLAGYLKKSDLDLFHGLSNELPRGIHKTGIPSVVTIHDLIFMRYPEFYKPIDRNIYFRKIKYSCTAADKIIAISQQTRSDVETFFQVPPEKIEVIYQPVAAVFFDKQDSSGIASRFDIPSGYILSVGTLEPRKNQMALLQALHEEQIECPVVFVGKPTAYVSKMKKFIDEKGMKNNVIFLSGLSEEELAFLYQHAVLSVYISVFEGFGLPVIEAMASGCPVITSSVSCLPETAGEAAVLCDPGNISDIGEKLNALLNDDALRKQLIEKGLMRAEIFHPGKYSKNLISLYTKILTENDAGRSEKSG